MTVEMPKKGIDYGLLLILTSRLVINNEKLFFLITSIYFLGLLIVGEMLLFWPKIPGFSLYLITVGIAIIGGVLLYDTRDVIRDVYYYLPTVLWIFIGYYIGRKQNDDKMFRTLCCYGAMITLSCLIQFASNLSFSVYNVKTIFGNYVADVGIIMAILVYNVVICKEIVFTVFWDKILIALMSIQIIFSFGRIAILEPLIIFIVATSLAYKYRNEQKMVLSRIIKICAIVAVIILIFLKFIPTESIEFFVKKIVVSFTEINADQTIASVEDAMVNWRAYEIQAAIEQWKENNILQQLIGEGMGAGIHLNYVPYNWKSFVIDNQIPLLHNGFMTHLIKGGIIGVLSMAIMMISPLRLLKTGGGV